MRVNRNATMNASNYSLYFVNIIFANGTGKIAEIVAIDEDAAKSDIIGHYGDFVTEIQIGRLGAA